MDEDDALSPLPSPILSGSSGSNGTITEDAHGTGGSGISSLLLTRQRLSTAIHVLNTEATSLRNLVRLYETDRVAGAGFDAAVEAITRNQRQGAAGERGKVVFVGVGKSGHIAKKLVATFNSLGVRAAFLHPTEALHGDLGGVGPRDTVLFVTFSGRTPELLALLPHLDERLPAIVLTAHRRTEDCELTRRRPGTVLLPAPIHEPEPVSFGVAAPTTSTTTALALGDALAVAAAQELHRGVPGSVSGVFARNHPGGAIGAAFQQQRDSPPSPPPPPIPPRAREIRDLAVPLGGIPATGIGTGVDVTAADVLKAALDSQSGWVRIGDGEGERAALVSPSRIRGLEAAQLTIRAREVPGLVADRSRWVAVAAGAAVGDAAERIQSFMRAQSLPESADDEDRAYAAIVCDELSILAVVENEEVIGVLEAKRLLELGRAA